MKIKTEVNTTYEVTAESEDEKFSIEYENSNLYLRQINGVDCKLICLDMTPEQLLDVFTTLVSMINEK